MLGAGIICVDTIVQQFPGRGSFRIQDSGVFLSASLSLSFGVMLFSALYGMLPSANKILQRGGFSPQAAAFTLIGCFLGGVIAIQGFSSLLHHHIPTHVVDCDHSHSIEDKSHTDEHEHDDSGHHKRPHHQDHKHFHIHPQNHSHHDPETFGASTEDTPLLSEHTDGLQHSQAIQEPNHIDRDPNQVDVLGEGNSRLQPTAPPRRQSFPFQLPTTVSSLIRAVKPSCDECGPCFGFSDPCGHQCFNHLQQKTGILRTASTHDIATPKLSRSATAPQNSHPHPGILEDLNGGAALNNKLHPGTNNPLSHSRPFGRRHPKDPHSADLEGGSGQNSLTQGLRKHSFSSAHIHHDTPPHHHHVPTNAFLSIGLQTSIAIALHKLPEGFITFATNHANPQLGFAVFMALFIHNITEGFAMALPLFLALQSRWKAMFWSSLLGGLSQPVGAGVAALWFKLAGEGNMKPGEAVYGIMFAVTSGIMTSVALQLFSEALSISHNRPLCITFAFIGMGILGTSFALTAG
ncbi:hypothetical protein FGG08_005101 [Glutinoglossum americanum]|uniref:Zinc/iron permease n=1 Tax=Glutinoglossum americanum TaxID=1670608 RepID=A0A9P8HYU9_9PEZI|nr:hypothetical protein FGG08_005101 [Glutinoglossum americanum]